MSRHEALAVAAKYGLIGEVIYEMDRKGLSPEEALSEWDIFDNNAVFREGYDQRVLAKKIKQNIIFF